MSYMNKLAFSLTVILRIYTQDDIFSRVYIPVPGLGPIRALDEIQVGLAFARDYDAQGRHTNGVFQPYWDQSSVTSKLISDFKKNYTSQGIKTKVFATIGGRGAQFPFKIKGGDIDTWVSNAAESLTCIIKRYNLDGIDVYYEHIDATKEDFVHAIGKLIEKLKNKGTITTASIAPSAVVNDYYVSLYAPYKKSIDTVVYQLHNEVEPVPDPKTLAKRFNAQATKNYDADKLLAGYSTIYKDWDTVVPTVYFVGGIDILGLNSISPFTYSAVGTSIWFVPPPDKNCLGQQISVSHDWPKWMLDTVNAHVMAS